MITKLGQHGQFEIELENNDNNIPIIIIIVTFCFLLCVTHTVNHEKVLQDLETLKRS